jgi:hypothetical protein
VKERSMNARPRAKAATKNVNEVARATPKKPVKLDLGGTTAGAPDYGIVIVVPDPDDLDLGATNTVQPEAGFLGRAVLLPPGSLPNVDPDQYSFVAYVSAAVGPTAVYIPVNADGVLFADLPNGVLPPKTVNAGMTLFDAISSAINNQVGPPPPDGTGNG